MVSTDRKKELKAQFLTMKPDMGVFIIRSNTTNKFHVQTAKDFRAVLNSCRAKLASGFHPIRELQKEWTDLGAENFTIEILEKLDYDHDESKTDYQDELELLKAIWEEKLTQESLTIYKKKI